MSAAQLSLMHHHYAMSLTTPATPDFVNVQQERPEWSELPSPVQRLLAALTWLSDKICFRLTTASRRQLLDFLGCRSKSRVTQVVAQATELGVAEVFHRHTETQSGTTVYAFEFYWQALALGAAVTGTRQF